MNEIWFIPVDILMILCACLVILCCSICLLVTIFDKTCHTVPMMLVSNTFLSGLVGGCTLLSMAIFTLQNDSKQIAYEDSLCSFRNYIICTAGALCNYSFLLQALYRYILVVHPNRLFYQSFIFQLILISITWICCFAYGLVCLVRNEIVYNVENQICELIYDISFSSFYRIITLYIIPVLLTVFVYIQLVRYVKKMQKNVAITNALVRAKNELKMVSRLLILVSILIVAAFPYTVFILLSFFNSAPRYKFRLGFLCINLALIGVSFTQFQFTDPLKSFVMKILRRRRRRNIVVPALR